MNEVIKNTTEETFHFPKEGFTDIENEFLTEAMCRQQKWLISNVESIISKNPDNRAKVLYEIADMFRINFVESNTPRIEKLNYEPYREVLYDAIYGIDNFKIAEEILKQYEKNISLLAAS